MAGTKKSGNRLKGEGRLNPKVQEQMRSRIKGTMIIQKLLSHCMYGLPMSATQLRAAEILLKKTLPDLSSIEIKAEIEAIRKDISDKPLEVSATVWQEKHKETIDVVSIETVN